MKEIIPNEEFIEKNYNKTIELIQKKASTPELFNMVEALGERYAVCPASSHQKYFSAFPGGLCYHNLHVLQWLGRFSSLQAPGEYSAETLLKLAILHSIGKVGDLRNDLYTPTQEDWKIRNGSYYDINQNLAYMRIPQRSLFLASEFKIPLTQDEYTAIMLAEGQYDDANSSYRYREPKLALILQYATLWAQRLEKENKVVWP